MVAKHVEVVSRAVGSDSANRWESDGADGYTVTPCEKSENGTKIVLTIKDNTETENYDEFLEPYRVQGLVKKYSDYIRYPIKMDMTRSRMKEKPADAGDDYKPEWEEYTENETLNSMVPIWKKSKKDLKDEDYNSFYTQKFFDYQPPLCHIHTSVEGPGRALRERRVKPIGFDMAEIHRMAEGAADQRHHGQRERTV